MLNLIKQAMLRNKLQARLEADLRLNDLCQKAGEQVARCYGQRGTQYDVLAEVDTLCLKKELGENDGVQQKFYTYLV